MMSEPDHFAVMVAALSGERPALPCGGTGRLVSRAGSMAPIFKGHPLEAAVVLGLHEAGWLATSDIRALAGQPASLVDKVLRKLSRSGAIELGADGIARLTTRGNNQATRLQNTGPARPKASGNPKVAERAPEGATCTPEALRGQSHHVTKGHQ